MADYPISNVARRIVYTGSAGVGPYAFPFEVLTNTDINVYKNDTLLTLTTNYTVTISPTLGTGSITLVVAATGSDRITIIGARAIQRTTDFTTGGDFFANTLNDEMDSQTILVQQVAETAERSIRAPVTDPTSINMTLPNNTTRASKFLSFDANGNPQALNSLGKYKGNWASGVAYVLQDIIKDTSNNNIYICITAHTSTGSQPISSNADVAKWSLMVDAASASTSASNASSSASAASTSATNAASSASSASTSASTATTQASNAATSATNAANSATLAATYAPSQTGNSGKLLTTNGTATSWKSVTGTGDVVLSTSPTLVTPVLGTPTSATLTNATGLPIVAGTTGTLSVARGGTGTTTSTGTGSVVLSNSPTIAGTALTVNSTNTYINGGFDVSSAGAPVTINGIGTNLGTSGDGDITIGNTGSGYATNINDDTVNFAGVVNFSSSLLSTGLIATIATGQTTGNITIGGTGASGTITLGRSTGAQTVNIATGTTAASTTKIINIGNAGNATSITNIAIGSTTGTSTTTLNGKTSGRIVPRVLTTTSSATPTINTDNTDQFGLTAQAVDITSFTANLSGTPTDGQKLWIYIVGTAARAIAWGASFESSTVTLPTTTVTTARLDVGFVWNAVSSKWRCVAVA